jgi:hypothetical protein
MRAQYVAEVGSGRRVWPRSIKERVVQLEMLGVKAKAISEQTGIGYDTLLQWRYQRNHQLKQKFHEVGVGKELVKVGTVTVPAVKEDKIIHKIGTVTVTTPSGYRIEGTDSQIIMDLLKGMGRCF